MKSNSELSILYAEDDEDACLMLSTLLGFSGIATKSSHTAADALRLARAEQFDLYLLDSRLPDGSGWEL